MAAGGASDAAECAGPSPRLRPPGGGDGDAAPSRLNPAPDDYATTYFADKATLTVCAGGGGNGCISFLRDLFISEGPPNGGDGGPGGNVYIQAAYGETSLHKLARRRVVRAEHGKHGQGRAKNGRRGDDVILTVPVGTVVTELGRRDPAADEALLASAARRRQLQRDSAAASGEQEDRRPAAAPPADATQRDKWLLYPSMSSSETRSLVFPRLPRRPRLLAQPGSQVRLDLSRPTPRPILLATGGNGGLGNPHFVTSDTARPLIATRGDPGMSMKIELELKLLADVGLVGLPNTGKSTLLRALSNSRARVGSWAFTTLQPNIGTVVLDNNKGRPLVSSVRRKTTPHPKVVLRRERHRGRPAHALHRRRHPGPDRGRSPGQGLGHCLPQTCRTCGRAGLRNRPRSRQRRGGTEGPVERSQSLRADERRGGKRPQARL